MKLLRALRDVRFKRGILGKGEIVFVTEENRIVQGPFINDILQGYDCEYVDAVALNQENLQRLEEVKGLQRKVESLTNFSNQKAKDVKRLNEDIGKAWAAFTDEYAERALLEATLERAMLDHQPVILPKFVIDFLEAERFVENREQNYWKERVLLKLLNHQISFVDIKFETILQALANGYTVEQTDDEKIRAGIKEVYVGWAELPEADDNSLEKEADYLSSLIADYVKEHYSK